ncbi:MAG TPA: hypothetical protein PKM07_08380 [Spirochaetota bacterium]|nr:hypothetical protein [Spirochaetota bacterium]HOH37360.1 hypothetical protein [Spirochaetota bacterium]
MKKLFLLSSLCVFSFLSAQDAVESPVQTEPEAAETQTAEKPVEPVKKTKTAKETKSAPVQVNASDNFQLLDISSDDFLSKRIPDIKIDPAKMSEAKETEQAKEELASSDSAAGEGKATLWLLPYIKPIAIVAAIFLIAVIIKLKDRKKKHKVFRVRNR